MTTKQDAIGGNGAMNELVANNPRILLRQLHVVMAESGDPEALVSGQEYYLYVLRDVVLPLARCLFQVP